MLKLKRSFFDSPVVRQALIKLSTTNQLDANTAYRVGKICSRIDKEMPKVRDLAIELLKKHAILDEIGMPKGLKEGKFEFKTPEDERIHDEEFTKMMDVEFEEHVLPIPLSTLKSVGLTPTEMVSIEAILDPTL